MNSNRVGVARGLSIHNMDCISPAIYELADPAKTWLVNLVNSIHYMASIGVDNAHWSYIPGIYQLN